MHVPIHIYTHRDPVSLEPAMLMLTDELLHAQTTGFRIRNFSKLSSDPGHIFWVKSILLYITGDYPGLGKATCFKHSGFRACHWCWHRFDTHTDGHMCAVDYRKHLAMNDPMRTNPLFGPEEHATPPAHRTHAEYLEYVAKIEVAVNEGKSKTYIQCEQKRYGILGRSALTYLSMFNIIWDALPDMMHITGGIWGKWLIPMFKGELIARNKPPKPPAKEHIVKKKIIQYTQSEMLIRNHSYELKRRRWEEVDKVRTCNYKYTNN